MRVAGGRMNLLPCCSGAAACRRSSALPAILLFCSFSIVLLCLLQAFLTSLLPALPLYTPSASAWDVALVNCRCTVPFWRCSVTFVYNATGSAYAHQRPLKCYLLRWTRVRRTLPYGVCTRRAYVLSDVSISPLPSATSSYAVCGAFFAVDGNGFRGCWWDGRATVERAGRDRTRTVCVRRAA